MNFEEIYGIQIDSVFKDSPVMLIGTTLFGKFDNKIATSDFLHMYMKLAEQWKDFKTHNISILLELNEVIEYSANFNIEAIFQKCIKEALQKPSRSVELNCIINSAGFEIKEEKFILAETEEKDITARSYTNKSVMFLCSKSGIKVFGDGVCLVNSNNTNIYDSLSEKPLLSIDFYKTLLKGFYEEHIKHDRMERYLLSNTTCPDEWKDKVKEDPFILINKPEKKFQIDLSLYLRNNCSDTIVRENVNEDGDRYDIWVSNTNQEVYIFELKWLGKSITETGNFTEYKGKRAIEGAWQLHHYLSEARDRGSVNPSSIIRQGILLVLDARSGDAEIIFPESLSEEINLDLDNYLRLCPKPFSASLAHKHYAK